jgi:hypothetical protein
MEYVAKNNTIFINAITKIHQRKENANNVLSLFFFFFFSPKERIGIGGYRENKIV